MRIYFLFAEFGQTFKQLLNNFQHQKPSNYKQLWGLRPDPICVYKKRTLIITCFSYTVKQAICHVELTSISKTMITFSKSANNFRRGNNIYFLDLLISTLPAFWWLIWCSVINMVLVTCISGFDSLRDICHYCNFF